MKTKYQYGDCIPQSRKIYEYLNQKGYTPYMVEGWAEVSNTNYNIYPEKDFLFLFLPKEYEKLKNINYCDYPKVLQHTWVEVNNHKIDITKNQFDKYGGIKKYYIYERYTINNFGILQKS